MAKTATLNIETGEVVSENNYYHRGNLPPSKAAQKIDKNVPKYKMQIQKDGTKKLVKDGQTNLYEKIQIASEGTDIYDILDRYNKGQIEVLEKTKGTFGDFTKAPKTLAETQQAIIDAKAKFYELPLELRREFNHDPTQFLRSLDTKEFEKTIENYIETKQSKKQKSTKEIETKNQEVTKNE